MKEQIFYYSTNTSVETVYSIRRRREELLNNLVQKWDKANEVVSQNWDSLYKNALLLEGQTEHLGFSVETQEEDYYAPQRIWITFSTKKGSISIEFHRREKVKKILSRNGCIKIWDIKQLLKIKNEWSFVERALSILL